MHGCRGDESEMNVIFPDEFTLNVSASTHEGGIVMWAHPGSGNKNVSKVIGGEARRFRRAYNRVISFEIHY